MHARTRTHAHTHTHTHTHARHDAETQANRQTRTHRALFEPVQKLLLNRLFQPRRDEGLLFSLGFSAVDLLAHTNQLALSLELELSHSNQILIDLCEPLLCLQRGVRGHVSGHSPESHMHNRDGNSGEASPLAAHIFPLTD